MTIISHNSEILNPKNYNLREHAEMKNAVLKGIAYGVGVTFLISACGIDSQSVIPSIICFLCGGYLALFSYANDGVQKKEHIDKTTEYRRTNHE